MLVTFWFKTNHHLENDPCIKSIIVLNIDHHFFFFVNFLFFSTFDPFSQSHCGVALTLVGSCMVTFVDRTNECFTWT